jgi:hypothetical protein
MHTAAAHASTAATRQKPRRHTAHTRTQEPSSQVHTLLNEQEIYPERGQKIASATAPLHTPILRRPIAYAAKTAAPISDGFLGTPAHRSLPQLYKKITHKTFQNFETGALFVVLAHDPGSLPRRLTAHMAWRAYHHHAKIPQLLALGWMRELFTAINDAAVRTLAGSVLLGPRVSAPPQHGVRTTSRTCDGH